MSLISRGTGSSSSYKSYAYIIFGLHDSLRRKLERYCKLLTCVSGMLLIYRETELNKNREDFGLIISTDTEFQRQVWHA